MSCGVERHGQPGPEETHPGPRRPAAHLVDDLLLLGVLLSQAGHLSPQGLVLTATEWVWSTGWIPAATGAEGFHTQSNPTREGEGLWVATYRWLVPTPTRTGYVMMLGTGQDP